MNDPAQQNPSPEASDTIEAPPGFDGSDAGAFRAFLDKHPEILHRAPPEPLPPRHLKCISLDDLLSDDPHPLPQAPMCPPKPPPPLPNLVPSTATAQRHGGLLSTIQSSPDEQMMRPRIAATDGDTVREAAEKQRADFYQALPAIVAGVVLIAFTVFAHRRLLWLLRHGKSYLALYFARAIRWLRMPDDDEI